MPASSDGVVLVVCAANICRSPVAEFIIARSLWSVDVRSAGVHARKREPICEAAASALDDTEAGVRFASRHRSTRVDADAIAKADLILTASLAERTAIATSDLSSRSRTFTLVEAAALARSVRHLAVDAESNPVRALAAAMHSNRGRIELPDAKPRSLFGRRESFGIDVPDAHEGSVRSHAIVHRIAMSAATSFVDAYGRLTEVEPQRLRA